MSDVTVYIKNVKITPKKLRFLVTDLKKQSPSQAMHTLYYTPKKGAEFLRKAIGSALSNAKNTMNIDESLLQFKSVIVEEGIRLKRYRAGSKGMAKPFRRKYSHIKIVLTTGKNEAMPTGRQAKQIVASKDGAAQPAEGPKPAAETEVVAKKETAKKTVKKTVSKKK